MIELCSHGAAEKQAPGGKVVNIRDVLQKNAPEQERIRYGLNITCVSAYEFPNRHPETIEQCHLVAYRRRFQRSQLLPLRVRAKDVAQRHEIPGSTTLRLTA
jgi:hypothetical protein